MKDTINLMNKKVKNEFSFLDSEQSECRKSLCECDREMAMGILENEMSWKRQLHERYGFDREKYCSGMAQHDQGFEWQFQQMHDLPGFEKQDTLKLLKFDCKISLFHEHISERI